MVISPDDRGEFDNVSRKTTSSGDRRAAGHEVACAPFFRGWGTWPGVAMQNGEGVLLIEMGGGETRVGKPGVEVEQWTDFGDWKSKVMNCRDQGRKQDRADRILY